MRRRAIIAAITATAAAASTALAQDATGFYKRTKELQLILSAGEGGGYTVYGRVLAAHMSKHLPGNPGFVVQNMPGAGGLRATNHLFNTAPKDGSVIGLIHANAIFVPLYGVATAKFDATKFNWLGTMTTARSICVAWHQSPIRTWQDMLDKEFIVGGTGSGAGAVNLPTMLNSLFGTKIKVIAGYKGGNDIFLAMERGEVHGRCGGLVTAIRSTRPDWFPEKKVNVPIQIALNPNADFADSPTVMKFVTSDRDRQILELAFAPQEMTRPVLAPPGVPADRVALLRAAFLATLKDEAFLKEAEQRLIDIDPVDGETLATLIERVYQTPPDVLAAAKATLKPEGAGGEASD